MKVVCVDDKEAGLPSDAFIFPNGRVVYGETYTVTESFMSKFPNARLAYSIAEKPFRHRQFPSGKCGWAACRFVTLEYYQSEFSIQNTNEETVEV